MSIKIMIVDDDQFTSKILSEKLTHHGFEVVCVNSGKECLEMLEGNRPEVILLDIVMPEMDGIYLLKNIRLTHTSFDIPIIMQTGKNNPEDIVEALKCGANDYISKPVNIEIAIARINTQISLVKNYKEAIEKKEVMALNTLIATYNHEINNPLTIAYGLLRKAKKEQSLEYFDKIGESLQRVANIVKEIEKITTRTEYVNLEVTQKMYKIR